MIELRLVICHCQEVPEAQYGILDLIQEDNGSGNVVEI